MKWLLDTNALIWLFEGSPRMTRAKELFSPADTQVFISVISWWEIAIKSRAGKLPFTVSQIEAFVSGYDFYEMPLYKKPLNTYLELPHLHKDPFDHMLLAQAISYPMRFITGDSVLAKYSSLVVVV